MEIPIIALETVSNPALDLAQKAIHALCEPFDPWVAVPLAFLVDFPTFYLFYRRVSFIPSPLWSSISQSAMFAALQVVLAFIYRPKKPIIVTAQPVYSASKQKIN